MISEAILQRLEALIEPVCLANGVELVVVQHANERGGSVLRIIIDRPAPAMGAEAISAGAGVVASGVSLEDCTGVSRDVSALLDVHEDLVPGRYRLEVSSPGLDRPLVRARDFERFAGSRIKLRAKEPVGGRRQFSGRLLGFESGAVRMQLDDMPSGEGLVAIPLDAVARAHVVYEH